MKKNEIFLFQCRSLLWLYLFAIKPRNKDFLIFKRTNKCLVLSESIKVEWTNFSVWAVKRDDFK